MKQVLLLIFHETRVTIYLPGLTVTVSHAGNNSNHGEHKKHQINKNLTTLTVTSIFHISITYSIFFSSQSMREYKSHQTYRDSAMCNVTVQFKPR